MTGFTAAELTALLRPVEQADVIDRQDHTSAGQPRTRRRSSPYGTSPFPTMADTLRFMLTSVQPKPIQAVQGPLFEMSQSNANKGMHLLHTVLHMT